jgi:hypothetical protein
MIGIFNLETHSGDTARNTAVRARAVTARFTPMVVGAGKIPSDCLGRVGK